MLANISVFCAKFLHQGKHWWFGWIWKGEGKVRLSSFKSKPMATLISLGRSSRDVPSPKLVCFRRMKLLHFTRFLVLIFLLCPHLFGRGENTEQLSLLFHAAVMLLVRSPEPCLYCPGQGWGSELPQWVLKLVPACCRVLLLAEVPSALSNCLAASVNCLLQSHIGVLKDRNAPVNLILWIV